MKKLYILFLLPFTIACDSDKKVEHRENKNDSTEIRNEMIESDFCSQWSSHYDCKSDCSVKEENGKKIFNISVFDGKNLELLEPDIIASRIALSSYQYFRDSTNSKYDLYQAVVIPAKDSDSTVLNFEIEQLNVLEAKTKICEDFLFLLADNKYDQLSSSFAPEVLEMTSEESIIETFTQLEQNFGTLLSSNILGFSQPKLKDIGDKEIPLFQLKVVLVREKQNINLTFIMSMDPTDNGIYGFN